MDEKDLLDELTKPIIKIYQELEIELLKLVAERFNTYELGITGMLDYHLKKLQEMGVLNDKALKIIARYSRKSEEEIRKMLIEAGYTQFEMPILFEAYERGYIPIDPKVLYQSPNIKNIIDNSFKELKETFKLINTKALESTKQAYMDVLNKAYIETSSGIYDYNTSIKRGLKRMANMGITGATYKRGGKLVSYSIESVVRRDTLTAVHQLANKTVYEGLPEIGADFVEVSSHLGARVHPTDKWSNHAGWQGNVYKIEGKTKEYKNLVEETGYGDIKGLGGVNCRHKIRPFIPNVSKRLAKKIDPEENERLYKATQRQRYLERQIRKYKKMLAVAESCQDDEMIEEAKANIKNISKELNRHTKEYGLKRDPNREMTTEDLK